MLAVAIGRVFLVKAATGSVRWDVASCPDQKYSLHSVAMAPDGRFVASVSDLEENWKLWGYLERGCVDDRSPRRNRSVRLRSGVDVGRGSGCRMPTASAH